MMRLDAGPRVCPAIESCEARGVRTASGIGVQGLWTRLSPAVLLSISLPVWALDGMSRGPVSFWSALPFLVPVSSLVGLVAATVTALLGFLLQWSVQKIFRREFSFRCCVKMPALVIGGAAFLVIFLGGFALMNAGF